MEALTAAGVTGLEVADADRRGGARGEDGVHTSVWNQPKGGGRRWVGCRPLEPPCTHTRAQEGPPGRTGRDVHAGLEVKAYGGELVVEAMDQIEDEGAVGDVVAEILEGISHALEALAVVCDRDSTRLPVP